jgi:hypothetical protein
MLRETIREALGMRYNLTIPLDAFPETTTATEYIRALSRWVSLYRLERIIRAIHKARLISETVRNSLLTEYVRQYECGSVEPEKGKS